MKKLFSAWVLFMAMLGAVIPVRAEPALTIGRVNSFVLDQSAVPVAVTGTTDETVLASITVPGGLMGPHGALRIRAKWFYTNSANTKTLKLTLGSATVNSLPKTTTSNDIWDATIENRGVLDQQLGFGYTIPLLNGSGNFPTFSVDTRSDLVLQFRGILTNPGEMVRLESYSVEVLRP